MVAFAVGGLASCASAEAPDAQQAADDFLAKASSDPAAACELLAPDTRKRLAEQADGDCASGLQEAGLQGPSAVEAVTVAALSARVRMSGQAVFLARFDDGWRVTAAGCTRSSDDEAVPYDCELED